jgi:hypothetical protein
MKTHTKLALFVAMASSSFAAARAQSAADNYKAKGAMCQGADGLAATPAGKAMKAVAINDDYHQRLRHLPQSRVSR